MQPSRILLLAGSVMAGAIGLAGLAYAGDSGLKTLSLQLPGGQVTQIAVTQSVPMQSMPMAALPVAFAMAPAVTPGPVGPMGGNPFAPASAPVDPFVQLEQISAAMNQQAAAMMQAMQIMAGPHLPGTNPLMPAAFAHGAAGSASYAFVSISSGNGTGCMQSLQITSGAPGQATSVVQQSAGACGAAAKPGGLVGTPAVQTVTPAPAAPQLLRVRDVHPIAVPQASQT